MRFRNLPAIVTLSAALIANIILMITGNNATNAMWQLLIVVIVFLPKNLVLL